MLKASNPQIAQVGRPCRKAPIVLGNYYAIDPGKAAVTSKEDQATIENAKTASQFSALGKMAIFPAIMLGGYLILIVYFRSRGGYKAVHIHDPIADEEAATF